METSTPVAGAALFPFTIEVPSPANFSIPPLHLYSDKYQVEITLKHGDHTFVSSEFEMGVLKSFGSRKLMGQLSFAYDYEPATKLVRICGSDYLSVRGMTLITHPLGSDEKSMERASSAGFRADEGYRNRHWYHRAQLFPGVGEVFRKICQDANDILIKELQALSLTVITLKMLPELSTDIYHDACLLYEHGKLVGNLTPDHVYLPHHVVTIPDSQILGIANFTVNEQFANGEGTTEDTKPIGYSDRSWVAIWEKETGMNATICTTHNFPTPCSTKKFVDPYRKGGHVVKLDMTNPIPYGGDCFLFPICGVHNDRHFSQWMRADQYQTAVAMFLFGE